MVTAVYLIRHGQTVDSEEKKYKGHIDVPLSEEGIVQISSLARYLKGTGSNGFGRNDTNGLGYIYSSDLSRAVRSAEIIAEPFGLKPEVDVRLRERSFGKWEGMTFGEIQEKFPEAFEAWAGNPLKFSPIDGESTEDVSARVMPAFYDIVKTHEGHNIAIVAHGGVNRIILCDVLGIPLEHIFRVEQDFSGLTVIRFYGEMPVLKVLNSTAHLNGAFQA